MVILRDLINQTDFDEVWNCFIRHYEVKGNQKRKDYKEFYKKLKETIPNNNVERMYVYITVFKNGEDGEMHYTSDFNEDDNALAFEVTGGYENDERPYGLEACRHETWLGFYIDKETLEQFTKPNLIAHCLFEMTYFGIEQKRDEKGNLILD
jgi:hypothetical protein